MSKQFVYLFTEGDASWRNVLGGKGSNLAEMTRLGLPVPQGFIVSTDACNHYYASEGEIVESIREEIFNNILKLEAIVNKKFNNKDNPLLVSVRSGARASMPGMMDTVLNLGINDDIVESMAKINPRLAYDSYRRLIQMFADVIYNVDKKYFDAELDYLKDIHNYESDHDFSIEVLQDTVKRFKEVFYRVVGIHFPQDPHTQLMLAIEAVFKSWNNDRAKYYRRMHNLSDDWGTAVTIQEMVFGNMGEGCATGVAFSRNPATGENELYGEFLFDAQGEDVVAGTHTPLPFSELEKVMPKQYNEFKDIAKRLEMHYHDMQDMEFTIENYKLYILQTRSGKRTAQAAVKIANDLVHENIISKQEAIDSLDLEIIDGLLHPQFDEKQLESIEPIGSGLPASPGAASGIIVLDAKGAVEYFDKGVNVILVRNETSPEDIEGMHVSNGILTAKGGMTSHAAVVARGMGKACIVGSSDVIVYDDHITINKERYDVGEEISIDGGTGLIYANKLETQSVSIGEDFENILRWADELTQLEVYTNADSADEIALALDFGARGVGLVRTEHMFFEADRIRAVREMILSTNKFQREIALKKILPMQKEDFIKIFRVVKEAPMTIRYLDPPLHEFMPTTTQDIEELADVMNMAVHEIRDTIRSLHEFNPMMGHRGCRLAISYPEIAIMQTRAIIEAAIDVSKELNVNIKPELMIPLVGDVKEFTYLARQIKELADHLIKEANVDVPYTIGTMIELPRACVLADEIAKEVDFISFGTNDLTQMTYGFSRDDAGGFLKNYYNLDIYKDDPFRTLDTEGVGSLIQMAVKKARNAKAHIKIGVCGEHGGDPRSIAFFKTVGLDYVSCSPYRVPVARIALARS